MKKYAPKFECLKCDYRCSNKFLYEQHLSTQKHNRQHLATPGNAKYALYICEACGKSYKQRSGLWRHKKRCNSEVTTITKENSDLKALMLQMLTGLNKDEVIKDQMIDQLKEQNKIIQDMIPRLGNNNNNKFNINVFLNEDCRDAINMSEFIASLHIQLEDLHFTKTNGLIEGVSSILVNGLKQLDTYKRPIHCTDMKRETLYIKDNDEWDRENGKEILKSAIIDVAQKQRAAISDWERANPNWAASESGKEEYIQLVRSVMKEVNHTPDENKIIKSIAKETVIDK
tara:strand:+ start:860 stop:1717 length:858 start_codon:yes stop_codon:yes gene_type:complete